MSESMDPLRKARHSWGLAPIAMVISLIALAIVLLGSVDKKQSAPAADESLSSIVKKGVLRVGYGGYPPYTIVRAGQAGSNAGSQPTVSGFSVDLVNAIAARATPPLRVEWHQFSFDTMKADLAADRFDFIADPVFMTVPRGADFAFTRPYSYFGIAVALVKAGDNRFSTFKDLDRPGITIALAEGWTSSEFARASLTKPTFKSLPVTGDALAQMDEVLAGRADVALNDVPTVLQYARAHAGKVKALWLDSPPSAVAGGFVLRPQDTRLRAFLDASLTVLEADGTINRIDQKWKSLGFFPDIKMRPGAGIAGSAEINQR